MWVTNQFLGVWTASRLLMPLLIAALAAAEDAMLCDGYCSGHGVCGYDGMCQCEQLWAGHDCGYYLAGSPDMLTEANVPAEYKMMPATMQDPSGQMDMDQHRETMPTLLQGTSWISESDSTCIDSCSGHGTCNSGSCACEAGWDGVACSTVASCHSDCGANGQCIAGTCACSDGFYGPGCLDQLCANNCYGHGQCGGQGTCLCENGWAGLQCEMMLEVSAETGKEPILAQMDAMTQPALVQSDARAHRVSVPVAGMKFVSGMKTMEAQQAEISVPSKNSVFMPFSSFFQSSPAQPPQQANVMSALEESSAQTNLEGGLAIDNQALHQNVEAAVAAADALLSQANQEKERKEQQELELQEMQRQVQEQENELRARKEDASNRIKRAIARAHEDIDKLPGHEFASIEARKPQLSLLEQGGDTRNATQTLISVYCGLGCSGHGTCSTETVNGVTTGKCQCQKGWMGSQCDMQPCPNDCSGNGMCIAGRCVCGADFYGQSCENVRCPGDCSGNGYCFQGRCQCTGVYGGAACTELVHSSREVVFKIPIKHPQLRGIPVVGVSTVRSVKQPGCPYNCSGHGDCMDQRKCTCYDGYSGPSCKEHCPNQCSFNGKCLAGSCLCMAGFQGPDCGEVGCCNGHGECKSASAKCTCDPGWVGSECNIEQVCPDSTCSGHGVCTSGSCMCAPGWSGAACSAPNVGCLGLCGAHGTCNEATGHCLCQTDWGGDYCQFGLDHCGVDHSCSGHGTCTDGFCVCEPEYDGETCSNSRQWPLPKLVEGMHADCVDCAPQTYGPANQAAPHWVPAPPGSVVAANSSSLLGVKANRTTANRADAKRITSDANTTIPQEFAGPLTMPWIKYALPTAQKVDIKEDAIPSASRFKEDAAPKAAPHTPQTLMQLLGAASKGSAKPSQPQASARSLLKVAAAKR